MGLKVRKNGEWVPISGVGAPGPPGPTGPTGSPSNVAGPTGASGGLDDSSTVHNRLTSDFSTNNETFENGLSATIDPVQTNSKILVLAVGAAKGIRSGNQAGQQANAIVNVTRGNTTIGRDYEMHKFSNSPSTFSQAILDTNNHGGNSVTYNIVIKTSNDLRSVTLRDGASLVLIEVV